MKEKSNSEKVFLFCPKCSSVNLKHVFNAQGYPFGQLHNCMDCGYSGIVLEGDYKFINNFKKNLNEKLK
ncbi:MAG: hypothetical protein JW703_03695 [Candidatus Diapherotrites archaeon]|nr:hypothetical protein [Candidatus Diapherotrites archaeon]